MRDWIAYADHLRALAEQDPSGVFVGADVVLEMIEERREILRAMVEISAGNEICEYCEHVRYAENCVEYECDCEHCHYPCECRSCTNGSGFVWTGRKSEPAPEVTVEDALPACVGYTECCCVIVIDPRDGVSVRDIPGVIEPSLEYLRAMVDGNIETMEFRAPGMGRRFVAIFSEEGKLKNLPANKPATEALSLAGDYLSGTVLVLKIEGENIVGLTTSEAAGLMGLFGEEWEAQV